MTADQRAAFDRLRALAMARRHRVIADAEGWPVIPGRLGRIEDNGDGRLCAVYTDRPRLFAKLWAIPGVRRWQTGDTEMRAVFPHEALPAVATVIRARTRRRLSAAAARNLGAGTAYRFTMTTPTRATAGERRTP